jgi:hypothetical protein
MARAYKVFLTDASSNYILNNGSGDAKSSSPETVTVARLKRHAEPALRGEIT